MLVGSFSGLPYRTFLLYEAPVAVVGLACVLGVVWFVYRRDLVARFDPAWLDTQFAVHYPLMLKTG
jgi:Na+/H+ antiporter NhaD/arsenite permease-like protein